MELFARLQQPCMLSCKGSFCGVSSSLACSHVFVQELKGSFFHACSSLACHSYHTNHELVQGKRLES
eukprot:1158610-Pelagomonas_calceolata.AAC.7